MSELHYLHGVPAATGIIKARPDDFVVIEDLGYPYDGDGEQLLVRIRKTGLSTSSVAMRSVGGPRERRRMDPTR